MREIVAEGEESGGQWSWLDDVDSVRDRWFLKGWFQRAEEMKFRLTEGVVEK
jgi:hypothetical protein